MMDNQLRPMLVRHEGLRLMPYVCLAGRLTIGYGRNLSDNGISTSEADMMLENDAAYALASLEQVFPDCQSWVPARRNALVDMMFNIGPARFAGFKKMIVAIRQGDWSKAAREMRDSLWAKQVPTRAEELARMVEEGE